jgi:hypothetical protein
MAPIKVVTILGLSKIFEAKFNELIKNDWN